MSGTVSMAISNCIDCPHMENESDTNIINFRCGLNHSRLIVCACRPYNFWEKEIPEWCPLRCKGV